MNTHVVYLVPGFFGFTSLGAYTYFYRVAEVLEAALLDRGLNAKVIECPTQPTGSLKRRAERVIERIDATGGTKADHLHFVGHSTGGLDVRLLLTPGVRLRPDKLEEQIGNRTRTAIFVSTPHFGTPLSNFFTTVQGRHILRLLSVLATTNHGRYMMYAGAQLVAAVARMDDVIGRNRTFLDALSERLLRDLTPAVDDPFWHFIREVSSDQGAIIQLTPEGMHLFNAAVVDRPHVHHGCVITCAPARRRPEKLTSPLRVGGWLLFTLLHHISAMEHDHYPYPSPAGAMRDAIESRIGAKITSRSNDGIVPTLSQAYGELIDAVVSDHLDVVGQFRGAGGTAHSDWLVSGSAFDDLHFQRVWGAVANAIARHA